MANFGQLILTNLGIQEQYKAQSGNPLKFKRIGLGSGRYTGNIMALTKLVAENVSVDITNGYIQNNTYTVEGFFSNEGLQTGFQWREIGLFVEDLNGNEILYCYANAGDSYDYIPATEDERYSKYIRVATAIGNATNVSIVENNGIIYVDTVTFNRLKDEVSTLYPVKTGEGSVVVIEDSANLPLVSFSIYGKSEQDGIPTPDEPKDIKSVGDSGNIEVKMYGKNLLAYPYKETTITKNGLTFTDNGDGSITVNGTSTNTTYFSLNDIPKLDAEIIASGCPENGSWSTYQISVDKNGLNSVNDYGKGVSVKLEKADTYSLTIVIRKDVTVSNLVFNPQAEIKKSVSGTPSEHEDYREMQSLAISTPNGLRGIPVASGGNYTDKNGQQWVCDEIDLERGVYIQRITKRVFNGTESWMKSIENNNNYMYHTILPTGSIGITESLCDKLVDAKGSNPIQVEGKTKDITGYFVSKKYSVLYVNMGYYMTENTVDAFKAMLSNNPITVQYVLATPVETPLTDKERSDFEELHSNNPTTTILNDSGAWMSVHCTARTFEEIMGVAGVKSDIVVGKECLTNETFNGKPVYEMVIDKVVTLESGSDKSCDIEIVSNSTICDIVDVDGFEFEIEGVMVEKFPVTSENYRRLRVFPTESGISVQLMYKSSFAHPVKIRIVVKYTKGQYWAIG